MTPNYEQYREIVEIARDKLIELDFDLAAYQTWVNSIEEDYLYEKFRLAASDPAIGLRPKQEMPIGDWYIWALITGRGFGKNHAASVALNHMAEHVYPGQQGLIVGATFKDVRSTIFGGESGLKALARPGFEPRLVEHNAEIIWPNGSKAAIRTGDNPEDIRGLTVPWAYCDELLKWQGGKASWKNVQMCVREGSSPRIIVTSTPKRGREWIKDILELPSTVVTRGKTAENYSLPDVYHDVQRASLTEKEFMEESEGEWVTSGGCLWSREQLDSVIVKSNVPLRTFAEQCDERLIAVDPSSGKRDLAGMVLLGRIGETYWLLDDITIKDPVPRAVWEKELARWVDQFLQNGDTIVVERNGFEGIDEQFQRDFPNQYVVGIHQGGGKNSGNKSTRAERAQALYEKGRVKHFKPCVLLERQMEEFYDVVESNDESPDRVDALSIGLNYMQDSPPPQVGIFNLGGQTTFGF